MSAVKIVAKVYPFARALRFFWETSKPTDFDRDGKGGDMQGMGGAKGGEWGDEVDGRKGDHGAYRWTLR